MGRSRTRRRRVAASSSEEGDEEEMETTEAEGSPAPGPSTTGTSRRQEEVDTSDPVIAGLRASMDNLIQLVKDIVPTCDTEQKKSEVTNRMKGCMMNLVRTEINYIEGLKLVDRTADNMSDIDEDADDHAILAHSELLKTTAVERVNTHRSSLKDAALKKHPYFVRLVKDIEGEQNRKGLGQKTASSGADDNMDEDEESDEEDDEEDVADLENDDGAEMIPHTDPITKLPLTDPIRNTYCNHIYGKASILAMLHGGNKTRCPTVGCSNKRWILAKHLQEDPALTLKVQKRVREAQKNRANTQRNDQNTFDI